MLSGLLAAVFLLVPKSASAQSTWANTTATSGTLVATGTSGYYYDAATLNVGDAIYVTGTGTGTGVAVNSAYYVVSVIASGSTYAFSTSPGGSIGTAANTAGTTGTTKGVITWGAAGATDTQSGATWNNGIPNSVDAVANITNTSNGGTFVVIQNPSTVGTINFSASSNDLNLISSNLGTSTTLSALTFATSSVTGTAPTIDSTATTHIIRLGANDASARNGQLKISGTQGLILEASNSGTQIRIDNIDWSGFTDGNGGRGTLTVQSGTTAAENANVLGSGTGAINLVVGNASTTGSAGAIFDIAGGATQQVNVLSGATNGYIYSAVGSEVLTVGTGGGTGGNFAGVIGLNPYGGASANTTTTNISLIKSGTGVQTISGQIVGASAATNTVTVNGGTLILSGSNSYGGATTVNGGTLSLQGANAVTLNTVTVNSAGSLTDTAANGLSGSASLAVTGGTATLSQANNYSGATTLSSGALYINNAGALGSGTLTLSGGSIDATNGPITSQSNNPAIALGSFVFGGSNNLNLGAGAVSIAGSATTITLNGSGSTLTLGGTATNTNSSTTTGITTTVNGAVNTLVINGGFTLGSNNTQVITDTFSGSGNIMINGAVINGTAFANSLTYSGNGTLTLSGSNSYSGFTTVTSGTLTLGNVYALGSSVLSGTSGIQGALNFNGNSITNSIGDKAILGGTLTNTGAAVNLTGMGTIGASASRSFFFDGTGNMTFGQQFTGLYSVTKNGSNTVTLSGAGANALTVTAINNGTLVLAKTGGVNAVNGTTLGISGGTLQLAGSNEINNGTAMVLTSGVFDMNGQNQTLASVKLAGTGISSGGALINSAASTSSTLTGVVTLTANSSMGGSGNLTVASSIGDSGSGYGITKVGAGTLTLSASNSYAGGTTIDNGTIVQTVAGALSTGTITLGDGVTSNSATLTGSAASTGTDANAITVASGGTGAYTIADAGADLHFSGNIALNNSLTLMALSGSGALFIDGTISGSSNITVNDNGSASKFVLLTANNASTFTGNVLIENSGYLKTNVANALGSSNVVTMDNTSTLDLSGNAETIAGLKDLVTGAGGSTVFDNGSGLTIAGAGNYSFSGSIVNGGGLTMSGAGTQTLSGSSGYTGATSVTNGTLIVSGSLSGSSGVTVAGATASTVATFEGTGYIANAVTIGNGSNNSDTAIIAVEPGSAGTTGTLTMGSSLTLKSDAEYKFNLNSTGGGSGAGADELIASSVSLNASAQFTFTDIATTPGTLSLGEYLPPFRLPTASPAPSRISRMTQSLRAGRTPMKQSTPRTT